MRRCVFLGFAVLGVLVSLAQAEDTVYFADANLKALVESALGKSNPTPSDMLSLTFLQKWNGGITDLTGLEHAANLTYLSLPDNEITDISPLSGLTSLLDVNLSGNHISDISALSGLVQLQDLSLSHNSRIRDIGPLAGLTNLTKLYLPENQIDDISPLSGLVHLTELAVATNPISDISPLSNLIDLTYLGISCCEISDISPLAGLDRLNTLSAGSNQISDISALAGLFRLDTISLEGNQIEDISVLAGIARVSYVSLGSNRIGDISALADLVDLRSLDLIYNSLNNDAYCMYLPQIMANNPSLDPGNSLYYSRNENPPSGVSASDGAYVDKVEVTWDCVGSVIYHSYYQVYRSESLDGEKTALTDWQLSRTFTDTTAAQDVTYYYWVKARTAAFSGYYDNTDYSMVDAGWCSSVISYTLSISSTSGGFVASPGEGDFSYPDGSSVNVHAVAQTGHRFIGWSGTTVTAGRVADPSAASTTVTVDADYTLIAGFAHDQRTLTISSSAGGAVTSPGEGAFSFDTGSSVAVSATPQANCHFTGWSGTAVDAGKVADAGAASTTVTMDGDYTLAASFALDQHTLTVSSNGGGAVTTPGEGVFVYDYGSVAAVDAAGPAGTYFTGWSGTAVDAGKVADSAAAGTTVTIDADYTLQANFEWVEYAVTISAGPGGTVLSPGEGCFTCEFGAELFLEAQADPGYVFDHWDGGGMWCSLNPFSLAVDKDLDITVVFKAYSCALEVASGDGGVVAVPGEGVFSYEYGTTITAIAIPDSGYRFAGWSGTLAEADDVGPLDEGRLCAALVADGTLRAEFKPASVCLYVDSQAAGDPNGDGTWDHPFGAIQQAIDASSDGQAVLVLPGTYGENLTFSGKAISVSAFDMRNSGAISQTVICGSGLGSVVTFDQGESANSILAGFTIVDGNAAAGGGIRCIEAGPIISNCVVAGNRADLGGGVLLDGGNATLVNCTIGDNFARLDGGGLYATGSGVITDSILWSNEPQQIAAGSSVGPSITYSDVEGAWPGAGNIDETPCFAGLGYWTGRDDSDWPTEPNDVNAVWVSGDYHLQSTQGRWEPSSSAWVQDALSSVCIDAGNPDADVHTEAPPNGDRLNLGAFGGTAEASLSPTEAAINE